MSTAVVVPLDWSARALHDRGCAQLDPKGSHTNPKRQRGIPRLSPRSRFLKLRILDFAPKGPEQISPGQRPGDPRTIPFDRALKGQL